MTLRLCHYRHTLIRPFATRLNQSLVRLTRPARRPLLVDTAADRARSKWALLGENALLRQQLLVLRRQVARPQLSPLDRFRLVLLAAMVSTWTQALLIVQPEPFLRWYRECFRLFRKTRSARAQRRPRIPEETITSNRQMAAENPLWGAERIRGELLKLKIRISKRTVQKYMRSGRPRTGQTWRTFLHNHAYEIWARDLLQVTDVWFRSLFAFFLIEFGSRKVVHFRVTRHPTDECIAQQLREATPFGVRPRSLIRDNDGKYGSQLARVAATSRIEVLRTPYAAPQANAICERFLGGVRRECLDYVLVLRERHLGRALREYVEDFNHARPHQGIDQAILGRSGMRIDGCQGNRRIVSTQVLGGLHHAYRLAA